MANTAPMGAGEPTPQGGWGAHGIYSSVEDIGFDPVTQLCDLDLYWDLVKIILASAITAHSTGHKGPPGPWAKYHDKG